MADDQVPNAPSKWICDLGNGEFDHDWQYVSDWGGDPEVIGGTFDCSFKRCRICGVEEQIGPGEVGGDFDDNYC